MSADRRWIAVGILGAIVLVLVGWFFLISPKLSSASDLRSQRVSTEDSNTVLMAKIDRLQHVNLDDLRSQLAIARQALPSDSGLPEFTRQLTKEGDASLVKVTSITAGSPVIVSATGAAIAGTPATTTQSAAGKVFAIPVTIVATGTPDRLFSLLRHIQADGPRRALITNTSFSPAAAAGAVGGPGLSSGASLNAQMQIFVAPQTPEAEAELEKLATSK